MRPADLSRLLLLAAIWGASFLFMRIAVPVLGSLPTAFFRASLGALGLLALLLLLRPAWDFKGAFRTCLVLGVINAGLPSVMYCLAALVLPAGYSSIFNATTPLMGVLIGALFFSEAMTASKAGGVALGLFGVAVLFLGETFAPQQLWTYGPIWLAVLLTGWDSARLLRKQARRAT